MIIHTEHNIMCYVELTDGTDTGVLYDLNTYYMYAL